jgi:hypothetical protein
MAKQTKTDPKPRFQVGDKVKFYSVNTWVVATVTEDRGQIGYKGRRLYGLQYPRPYDEQPGYLEMPEEELEPAT